MGVRINIDTKKVVKSIEKQLKENPEIVLKQNIGKVIDSQCPKCGEKGIRVVSGSNGMCSHCGALIKINLDISLK